ncbi:hypothetical protein ASE14_05435 [Agromyces sp. Root81]|nr:hypothetical protein ASE14_05435 [Agromyces sp. Root81]
MERLRELAPPIIMVSVDGPKPERAGDAQKVEAVHEAFAGIDWTDDVSVRRRPTNLGLRKAVVDAVSWAIAEHGQVIVIEEDVLPGPDFLPYMEAMLERHRDDTRIAHVSGYNVVPVSKLSKGDSGSRLTIYPESVAWGTWERAWRNFDVDLGWARRATLSELHSIVGSRWAAVKWRQNFADAAAERISTWAYRWIASMWSTGSLVVSPNRNLVSYVGADEGTHTVTALPWQELEVLPGSLATVLAGTPERDYAADAWVNRQVFHGTPLGVAKGVAVSCVLALRRTKRDRAARNALSA